ncbi:MAG: TRAP transporter substrate-binding protein DctP [Pseudomonadales bacterium]|nr:TRAP transporter substrate-binding protein DctP [Pseudomonadales bacterium]
MKLIRYTILTFLFITGAANAQVLKIATLAPDGSDWMNRMKAGAKEITERTDNRVSFKFYPGGVMGDDKAVLRKIKIGQLHGAALPSGSLAPYYPDSQVYSLPLRFRSFDEIDYVRSKMDSVLIEGFKKSGFVTFGLSEGGLAYTLSKSPVSSVADLQKLKVWVPDTDAMGISAMQTYGINPIPLSIGDVLTSLQTGLVNTVAASPIAAIALQWHNQVGYLTDLPLLYIYAVFALNEKTFNKIAPADQKIVSEVMTRTFHDIDQQNRKDNIAAFAALQTQGIQLVEPNPETLDEWYEKAEESVNEMVSRQIISADILHRLNQLLKEYRTKVAQK